MAITEIEMNTGNLQNDINELDRLLGQMSNQKQRLIRNVEEMNAMWTGQANSAFNNQFKVDMENFESMLQTLREMLESLRNAKKEYDSCEQRVASIIRGIAV